MKRAFFFAAKTWGYYLAMTLLSVIFTLGITSAVVQIILGMGLVFAFTYLAFAEGGYRGEKAVTLAETIAKQEKEGRRVLEELRPQVFNKTFALRAFLICYAPFFLVSCLNAAYYPVYSKAETAVVAQEIAPESTAAPEETVAAVPTETDGKNPHWAKTVALVFMLPFASLTTLASDGLNAILFFLYGLLAPLGAYIGYRCGPALHVRKLKEMQKGTRKKRRQLRVNREMKPPKAEV